MDRVWYIRFSLVAILVVLAWGALWPSLDAWVPAPARVQEVFTSRISPGLDIQGGLRLMYEVDVEGAVENHRDRLAEKLLPALGRRLDVLDEDQASTPTRADLDRVMKKVRVQTVGQRRVRVTFKGDTSGDQLTRDWLRESLFSDLAITSDQGKVKTLTLREDQVDRVRDDSVDQAVKAIENRVDELAIREMTVIGRETDIIIEIPGGDDTSRVVSTVAALAALESKTDRGWVVQVSDKDLAERAGLPLKAVQEVVARLAAGPRPYLERDNESLVIPDLERFKLQSTFEKVRSIISRQARLEFRVLEDENSFLGDLADDRLPEGVEKAREVVTIGEGREVTSTYLVARGENSRLTLQQFLGGLELPDGREVLVGAHEQDAAADDPNAEAWRTYFLYASTDVTGESVEDAYVGSDEQGRPVVQLEFDSEGADAFGRMTGANVKRRMAIVLDNRVESAPVIQERIGGGRCQITLGSYRDFEALNREAAELVVVLKAGALPADIHPSNEQLIGPTLGRDSIRRGAEGALVGIALVLIFMLFYYHVAGLVADLMVVLNIFFLLAVLAALEATLTLPGIAGIALTVGMAVDANVLITERIREELRLGKSPRSAVDQGFQRAFWSIFDAQLTTFIAGVVLFQYGTGPIKGFAVTLMIGIGTSLFTGVFCSKVALDWLVRGLRVQRLRVG